MSAVERAVPRVDVLLPSKMVEDVSINLSSDKDEIAGCFNRRLSRVSRLRDMFQTGIIRPVEEIDSSFDQIEPSGECPHDTHNHFLRTFPGSPPLSALRNHRARAAQQPESLEHRQDNSTPSHSTAKSSSCTSPGVPNRSVPTSFSTVTPPARPPKPRNLTLDSSLPSKPPPTLPKAYIPSEPKNSVAASDRCANTQANSVSSGSSNIFSAHLNDTTDLAKQISFDRSIDTTVSSVSVSASEVATLDATVASSQVLTINTSDTPLLTSNHLASPASSVASNGEFSHLPFPQGGFLPVHLEFRLHSY
ncbi:unnamed protein product [Dicrocoelium dendriticum]|nr:unnamed protein product [Dicrocoelium dendriticum]